MMEFCCHLYQALLIKKFTSFETQRSAYSIKSMSSLSERVVKAIWFDGRYDKLNLKTIDGSPVRVYSQGEWNLSEGPDFKDAIVQIGDADPVKGHVEIHVRTSDWKRHGHSADPNYRDVLLNVSMWHDDAESNAFNDLDDPIPHIELCDIIDAGIDTIRDTIDIESYPFSSASRVGECSRFVVNNTEAARILLEIAGQERLFSKARRLWEELCVSSYQDVFYNSILVSLGYKANKKAFRSLAACVPASVVKHISSNNAPSDRAEILQALYFGASNLFNNIKISIDDAETSEYCARIEKRWEENKRLLNGASVPRREWRLSGIRPANLPIRRMAGAAELFARLDISDLETIIDNFPSNDGDIDGGKQNKILVSKIRKIFEQPAAGYWAHRMTPGGAFLDSVPALIGPSLAASIVVNILHPLLLCRARRSNNFALRESALSSFSSHPSLEPHVISRLMRYRLWGDTAGGAKLMRREIIQQGLIQLFFDFCDGNTRDCSKCKIPEILSKGADSSGIFSF